MAKKTLDEKLLDMIKKMNLSPEEAKIFIKSMKYPNRRQIKTYKHGSRRRKFKFALLGDTHFGNKSTNKAALLDFYKRAHEKYGVTDFYHAGDMVDGLHVHRGQVYELYAHGVEQQVQDVIDEYPHLKNCKTHFITGNHDLWFRQNAGVDIGHLIDADRDDMNYLGMEEADIEIAKGTILRIAHPGDGSSYALSYKPQKKIEAFAGGSKPNILGLGHYHKMLQMFYRNVHAFLVGTFCEQTPWMRSKNLAAHVGGWIIEGKADKDGSIAEISGRFIPYYEG